MDKTSEPINIDWNYCQKNSEDILLNGINQLKESEKFELTNPAPKTQGNFLITNNRMRFVGESNNIEKRVASLRTPKTSTFYKNYQRAIKKNLALNQKLVISDFDYQILPSAIGRKEIEEFGVVNLPARLNTFQPKKLNKYKPETAPTEIWNEVQNDASNILAQGAAAFKKSKTVNWDKADPDDVAGIYQLKDHQGKLLYVGESNNVNEHWKKHSNAAYFSALRRNIGSTMLGFDLKDRSGKNRPLSDQEEIRINDFLSKCKYGFIPVSFGRFELEEKIRADETPILNTK